MLRLGVTSMSPSMMLTRSAAKALLINRYVSVFSIRSGDTHRWISMVAQGAET